MTACTIPRIALTESAADYRSTLGVVVTGLPGSGKTTVGSAIAVHLNRPLLDKDDFLEQLFEQRGTGDAAWRRSLSRESDERFHTRAREAGSAVLVSHWRTRTSDHGSGTPTQWLSTVYSHITEVFCDCAPDLAVERFVKRRRHPGHLDARRSREEIADWMRSYRAGLPLQLGKLIVLDTGQSPQALSKELDAALSKLTPAR